MISKIKQAGALALIGLFTIGCSGGGGGGGSDVTLSGAISTGGSSAGKTATGKDFSSKAISLNGYKLYCVTFTDSPTSNTGSLTPNGLTYTYNLTMAGAAGDPIGCFINNSSNAPVATVTFNVQGDAGIAGANTNGAALTGGNHTVNINFDPDTGTASATIAANSLASGSTDAASFISKISGSWNMGCVNTSNQDCLDFVAESDHVFVDVISGKDSGNKTLYAMGAWPNKSSFTSCGQTEGLNATALSTEGITNLTSYTTGGNVTDIFLGPMTDMGATPQFNSSNEVYTLTFNDLYGFYSGNYSDPDGMGSCPGTVPANMNTPDNRNCFIQAIEQYFEDTATCGLRFDSETKNTVWDPADTDGSGTVSIATQLGSSPELTNRYALMGLKIIGNTGVAYDEYHHTWTYWDGGQDVTCHNSHEMTLTLTPNAAGTAAIGKFATKEYEWCEDQTQTEPELQIFDVKFTPAADE